MFKFGRPYNSGIRYFEQLFHKDFLLRIQTPKIFIISSANVFEECLSFKMSRFIKVIGYRFLGENSDPPVVRLGKINLNFVFSLKQLFLALCHVSFS